MLRNSRAYDEPVSSEEIKRQQVEQNNALEKAGHGFGESRRYLSAFAPDISDCDSDACQQNPHRVKSTQKGNNDGCESITGRDVRHQLSNSASGLDHAGETGESATNQERLPEHSVTMYTRVPGSQWG